jgi:histidine triad (HIT) family protein
MSIDGVYDHDNVFAKVLRGEAPAAKVFEDGEVLALMDIFPQSRGHTLVISKISQARNILDVEGGHLCTLMLGVQRVAKAIRAALKPDGIIITQFNGAPAGQTIFHLHVHIIPRWDGEPMIGHGGARMADTVELAALAKEIAAKIA